MTVSPLHTSVPRWLQAPAPVDLSGTTYLVLACGEAGQPVAETWTDELEQAGKAHWAYFGACAEGWALRVLSSQLQSARVGVRLLVAAPELDVLDVIRVARSAGMLDAEIQAHVTDSGARRVQCPHCGEHTVARVEIGETVPCAHCARTLIVYHHVSRRHGAYLGYMVDAEEPAA